MKIRKIILVISIIALAYITYLYATPEFALWTDNRCSKCHVNLHGGGLRNEFGWNFSKDASMFTPTDLGIDSAWKSIDKSKYSSFDSLFAWGMDFRMQTVRSHKTEDAVRRIFPMQASLYLSLNPLNWLSVDGQVNIAPKIFAGQQIWSAALNIKPDESLPSLKIGYFTPSLGLRNCDMTALDRRIASQDGTESFIAPDYAEYGMEMSYEGQDWFTAQIGMFDSKSLSELTLYGGQVPLIPLAGNPSFTARAVLYPSWLMPFLPEFYFGASTLINGRFVMNEYFLSYALREDVHLYSQFITTNRPYTRATENFIAGVTYIPVKGVLVGFRADRGSTKLFFDQDEYVLNAWQLVANTKLFLLPYLELIPEYRYIDCEEYRSSRWALQLHLYY